MSEIDADLLEFGTIDVFYIAWQVNDKIYFLHDMTPELDQINWSTIQRNSFYFYTEHEAEKHAKLIKRTRPTVGVVTGEIDVIEDLIGFSI